MMMNLLLAIGGAVLGAAALYFLFLFVLYNSGWMR